MIPAFPYLIVLVQEAIHGAPRAQVELLIQQGGVTIDGQKVTDDKAKLTVKTGQVLKAGKLVVVKLSCA